MKRKIVVLTLLIFNFILFFNASGVEQKSNLVKNFGFEKGNNDIVSYWNTDVWDKKKDITELKWDDVQKHSGNRSIKITNKGPNDSRYSQNIKVRGDSYYRISCYIKTQKVGQAAKGANISVRGILDTSEDIKGSSEWKKVELYGKTAKKQTEVALTLGLGGYGSINTGEAWFDDLEVLEVNEIPKNASVINLFVENTSANNNEASKFKAFVLPIILVLILSCITILICFLNKKTKGKRNNRKNEVIDAGIEKAKFVIEKKDILIMVCMTGIYLVIALFNLGSFKAPQTSWTSSEVGESFILETQKPVELSRLYYFQGLGEGSISLEYENEVGKFVSMGNNNLNNCFKWGYIAVSKTTSKLRVTITKSDATLNEIALFENGSTIPIENIKIAPQGMGEEAAKTLGNLIDEPDTVDYKCSYLSGTYFDEIYHAKTAFENINGIEPTETSHPPLGKLFIALGVLIFGMVPFGWRVVGTLFGAAMIPIIYLFAKKMFGKRFYAFSAAFLLMFDFMHFVQTRIATIDVYGTFFIILMYYYMYDYFTKKSYERSLKDSLKPLFLSGLFFGIGAASKWIALYGAGGLAVLFFMAKWWEYKDYKNQVHKKSKSGWVDTFINDNVLLTFLWCVLFFIIIPIVIYTMSYIPYLMVKGAGHNLSDIVNYQSFMFNYHNNLVADHPFKSQWFTWPFDYRPIWYFSGSDLPMGIASSISSFGNPAIWWLGALAVPASAIIAFKKKDKKMIVILVAIIFQYAPWILVSRIAFIYHFFSVVPFMILSIVYIFKHLIDKIPLMKYPIYTYLGIVLLLFIMFYPVLSGLEVPRSYIDNYLLWFKGIWVF